MSKKLPKIIFYLGIISVFLLLLQDFLFFWYVQTFNNLEYSLYLKIDRLLENGIVILLWPACYLLFILLKLSQRSLKTKLILYLLGGLILSFAFFHAFEAKPGQLSYDYTSFSAITLHRLYLKAMLVTLVTFYIFMPLAGIIAVIKSKNKRAGLKQFVATVGLGIGSLALAFTIVIMVEGQTFALLNKVMLTNKVKSTLPELPRLTKQQIVITDHPKPAIDCYLKQNPNNLWAKILNMMAGTYYLKELGYNSYYLNDYCFVVYLGAPLILSSDRDPTSMFLLSELLIRKTYRNWIRVNVGKHPVATITIRGEESFKEGSERGQYIRETDTIELQQGYDRIFEATTHELLHSFATTHKSVVGDFESGLGEAITQYLTADIMKYTTGSYKVWIYKDQVRAFETLLKYVDKETVFETYFNGDFRSLQKPVDSKTYTGAYCRFTTYLDRSLVEYSKTNFQQAKDYVDQAIHALETKEGDNLDCLK